MNYRYPFTPFPHGWYRVAMQSGKIDAFNRIFKLNHGDSGLALYDIHDSGYSLPALNKNGEIFCFYDENRSIPYFDVPDIDEFSNKHWQAPFFLSWRVRVHAQEIAENALDLAHFCTVHTYKDLPALTNFEIKDHQFKVTMHSRKKIFGFVSKTSMDIAYHGLGIVVANVGTNTGIHLKVLLTTTPVQTEYVDISMKVAIKKLSNPIKNYILRKYLPNEIKNEFTRDIPVWEGKIYRSKPLLCHVEGNIVRIRKWAKQFYGGVKK